MRYGLEISAAGACGDARTLADLAQLAEESGWDGVFLEDYIIHYDPTYVRTYDPWVALAAMALRTERIRLGTTVTPIARRRPWKLARELITLDHLSGGRMILGVGLGDGAEQSFTHFGEVTDPKRRAEMLDEGLLSMKPRVIYVTFACTDPGSLAAFWMEALGYDEEERGDCCSVGIAREG